MVGTTANCDSTAALTAGLMSKPDSASGWFAMSYASEYSKLLSLCMDDHSSAYTSNVYTHYIHITLTPLSSHPHIELTLSLGKVSSVGKFAGQSDAL